MKTVLYRCSYSDIAVLTKVVLFEDKYCVDGCYCNNTVLVGVVLFEDSTVWVLVTVTMLY